MSRSLSGKNAALVSQRHGDKNYKIFAVNYHGKSLEPIREEYIKLGLTGQRRRVIVINMEDERPRMLEQKSTKSSLSKSASLTKRKPKTSFEQGGGDSLTGLKATGRGSLNDANMDVTTAILAIQRNRRQYEEASTNLTKEREFNLHEYWQENLEKAVGNAKRKNSLTGSKSIDKDLRKKKLSSIKEDEEMPRISCLALAPQSHNKIGRPPSMLKKKFIEDDPPDSKLFVILIGKFGNNFYLELLKRGEPLQAIIHFYPAESSYDLLIPNPEHKKFVATTLENIESKVYELRKKSETKPTGIFRQILPKISDCLAKKYASMIYDQITWAFYDIEMLYRNYLEYYIVPFREINVTLPSTVSLRKAYHVTEALSLEGNYLQNPFPAIATDTATIILYMDMLFNTIGPSKDILTEWETILLSTPLPKRIYSIYGDSVAMLAKLYADAFYSITKIKKVERLFVEANNETLVSMVQYVDHNLFRHIYLACLEYKIQRKYIHNNYHRDAVPYEDFKNADIENFELPNYAKFYVTDDSTIQRLLALLDDFDSVDVTEIKRGHKLYQLRRNLNEVIEHNRMFTIPTRLCFRDFTLFKLEKFLNDLITLEMSESHAAQNMSDVERFEVMMRRLAADYNPDIFIRPNSLKARRTIAVAELLGIKTSQRHGRNDSVRERELQMAADALKNYTERESYVGLPREHPLLQGYNLEDIRQEIWVKTSKYFFEEGNLILYEERWNFNDTNKNLSLKVNENKLILGTPHGAPMEIEPLLRLTTKNETAIRLEAEPSECAKIVLNYPNGLSVYYQEKHTEQVWSRQDTPNNELRRIVTPHGAVIVHYHSEDMILVMRYNGEVFRLYQYEFVFSEEGEEEIGSATGRSSTERNTLTTTRSKMMLHLLDKDGSTAGKTDRSDRSRVPREARPIKLERAPRRVLKKRESKMNIAGGDAGTISLGSSLSLVSFLSEREPDQSIVADELNFLEQLMARYVMSYKHLIITTSMGRVFNLTHYGKFYETIQMNIEEWHDYFVDECYAIREDGVRMIWGIDYMKCFHSDGTIITTMTEDVIHTFDFHDEFAEIISESSSHKHFEEETIGDGVRSASTHLEKTDIIKRHSTSSTKRKRTKTYEPYLQRLGEGEEEGFLGMFPGYVCPLIGTQQVHHRNYACVYFLAQDIAFDEVKYIMEVKGSDDIIIQKALEPLAKEDSATQMSTTPVEEPIEESVENTTTIPTTDSGASGDGPKEQQSKVHNTRMQQRSSTSDERAKNASYAQAKLHMTSPQTLSTTSTSPSVTQLSRQTEEAKSEAIEEEEILREVLKVWIGTDFYLVASEEDLEIQAMIQRFSSAHKEQIRDTIKFKISYAENLQEIFQIIVAQIASFKKYHNRKTDEIFFLEKMTKECKLKGLEFMNNLPELGLYHHKSGNTITQFTKLETIFDKFAKSFEWYDKDVAKFPRFRMKPDKRITPLDEFPMVLSVNLFLKVPSLLRGTYDIHKFMDPLDRVNFKKTRYQIKETMNRYIYPYLKMEVKKSSSQMSWRLHHETQRRRKLIEAQRTGLYHAMLRHKTFPKYFMFQEKCNGKVECIDYFDYCLDNCMKKNLPFNSETSSPKHRHRTSKTLESRATSPSGLSSLTSPISSPKQHY